ncbi:plasmid mobilization protein MobA [Escherichia coli]|uniref:plasmid mobilization protein MobA n=1 Tax=Escherichia coli TaxID=562 RepID=UPI003C6CF67C
MTLSFFITVIPDHDKPQPPGCLLGLTAEEDQEIRKRAAECGKTVSGFLRAAALGKKVNSLTDDRVLKEVMRLGALQKKLFIDGKRVGDREYAEVLIAITEYHRALLSRLMAD